MQKSLRKTGRCGPVRQNIIGETTVERSYRGMAIDFTVRFRIDPFSLESLRALQEVRIQPGGQDVMARETTVWTPLFIPGGNASDFTRAKCLKPAKQTAQKDKIYPLSVEIIFFNARSITRAGY